MLAVLWDLVLDKYIANDASVPGVDNQQHSTKEMNAKACTDAEMIHISGTTTGNSSPSYHDSKKDLPLQKQILADKSYIIFGRFDRCIDKP